MLNEDKSKFLEIGLWGVGYETKKKIREFYIKLGLTVIGCYFMAYLSFLGIFTLFDSQWLAFRLFLMIGSICLFAFFILKEGEIDAIYDDGITHRNVRILDKRRGKHWISWNEIEKIYYGNYQEFNSEYVLIISGKKSTQYMVKSTYELNSPNFYPLLLKMLKEKATQAEWISKDE